MASITFLSSSLTARCAAAFGLDALLVLLQVHDANMLQGLCVQLCCAVAVVSCGS